MRNRTAIAEHSQTEYPANIYYTGHTMGIFDKLRAKLVKPAPEPANKPEPIAPPPTQSPVERRTRERVNAKEGTRALIIDDSATVVAALGKILRSVGYITLEAGDAEQGIQIARTLKPDLIFLDIVLPGMNGFAALRVLRRDPVTRDMPVIIISGNEQATEQFFGSRIGADDFMKKPFSRLEVFARIERLLDTDLVPRRVLARKTDEPSVEPASSTSAAADAENAPPPANASDKGEVAADAKQAPAPQNAATSSTPTAERTFSSSFASTTPLFGGQTGNIDNGPDTLPAPDWRSPSKDHPPSQ